MLNWQALIGHIYKIIECGSPKHHVVVVLWTFCVYVIWEGPKFLDWCTSQQKVDTTLYFYTSFNEHNTPYTVLESDNSESMPDVLH